MITLYGISNCDTIKKAKKYLTDNNIEFTFHDYRKDGVNESMVSNFADKLDLGAACKQAWHHLSRFKR